MRLLNVVLAENKRVVIALQSLYGIGPHRAAQICTTTKINPDTKVKDITETQEQSIRSAVEGLQVPLDADLRRETMQNIKRLQEIGSYRGFRHIRRLPVRGQRTKTNSRTKRGGKKQTIANKKKVAK